MGQLPVNETWVGNTQAAEMLEVNTANAYKTLSNGLIKKTIQVEAFVDKRGQVYAIRAPVGSRRILMWRRELIERLQRVRVADERRRAADEKRRETARAKAAAAKS